MAALLMVGVDMSGAIVKTSIPTGRNITESRVVAYGPNSDCRIEEGVSDGNAYVKAVTPSGTVTLFDGSSDYDHDIKKQLQDDFGIISSVNEDAVSYPYILRNSDVKIYGITEDKNLRLLEIPGAGFHNSIYRGKALGDIVTFEQGQAIKNGDFTDLFIGDYWEKEGAYVGSMNWSENVSVRWRIAGFDLYRGFVGDTGVPYTSDNHHVVLVPDDPLYDARMEASADVGSGYRFSEMFTSNINFAGSTAGRHFSYYNNEAHTGVMMRPGAVVTNVSDGRPTESMLIQGTCKLMTERNLFGSSVLCPVANGEDAGGFMTYEVQYPLFVLDPKMIRAQHAFWLSDMFDGASYGMIDINGKPNKDAANAEHGVRPVICIYI